MKLKKRIILNLLLTMFLLLISATTVQASSLFDKVNIRSTNVFTMETLREVTNEFTENGLYYQVIDGKFAEVYCWDTWTSIPDPSGKLVIPSSAGGYPVESIRNGAFYCESNEAVEVNFTSITIPNSITRIGDSAFDTCFNVTTVTFEPGSKLKTIGEKAFHNCQQLASITLPDTVESIGAGAFSECWELTSINIPAGVTSIANETFSECWNLDVTIPSTITEIGESAFYKTKVTNIVIPEGVTSIANGAFEQCSALTSITIPSNVTSIGTGAFSSSALNNVTIENGVMTIGEHAFSNCIYLKNIIIPDSVTSIGKRAFMGSGLETITFSKSMECINEYTFYRCGSLKSVEIPENITSIGDYAFNYCPKLERIRIPATVTSIGEFAIENDQELLYEAPLIVEGYKPSAAYDYVTSYNASNANGVDIIFNVIVDTYTVTWKNYDGTVLETDENVLVETMPSYNGDNPTKPSDAQYTYTFAGWSPAITEETKITADTTYTATYTETVNTYTVTWESDDGTILKVEEVEYGKVPNYGGEPTKQGYTFIGWEPAIEPVRGNAIYQAAYIENEAYIRTNRVVKNPVVGDIDKDGLITGYDVKIAGRLLANGDLAEDVEYINSLRSEANKMTEEELISRCDMDCDKEIHSSDLTTLVSMNAKNENKILNEKKITLIAKSEVEGLEIEWNVVDLSEKGEELATSDRASINMDTGEFESHELGKVKIVAIDKENGLVVGELILEIVDIYIRTQSIVKNPINADIDKDGIVSDYDLKLLLLCYDEINPSEVLEIDEELAYINSYRSEEDKMKKDELIERCNLTGTMKEVNLDDLSYLLGYMGEDKVLNKKEIQLIAQTEPEDLELEWSVVDLDDNKKELGTSIRASINKTTGEFKGLETGKVKIKVRAKSNSLAERDIIVEIVDSNIQGYDIIDGKYLKGIEAYTTWREVKANLEAEGNNDLEAKKDERALNDEEYVGTGTKIKIGSNWYIAVVPGDVTGDGKKSFEDITLMVNLAYKRTPGDAKWENGVREASLYSSPDWSKEQRYTKFEDITKLINDVYYK